MHPLSLLALLFAAATVSAPTAPSPSVHRAAFRDRAAMVLVDAGNGCWAAFNPRTASFDAVWRGDVDWRGKVFDFSQETSRPRGQVLRDRTRPMATMPDVTLAPGQVAVMRVEPAAGAASWHSLLVAFDERVRQPVAVRVLEADGSARSSFRSSTNGSSETEWQWNFKVVRGPALPASIEWRNDGKKPKPLRALRLEGEETAWTDGTGRAIAVQWKGYDLAPDAVTLRFELAAGGDEHRTVTQRVTAAGRGIRVETSGIPTDSSWKSALSADDSGTPRAIAPVVEIGVAP